ncbi:MAG: HNH endonuclease [Bryobacteraceae bacterium]
MRIANALNLRQAEKSSFEIDHFRPVKRFPEHTNRYPNLYYACGKCNRHKGNTWPSEDLMGRGFRFADPCEEDLYVAHVEEAPDGTLRARTNAGAYTLRTHTPQPSGPVGLAPGEAPGRFRSRDAPSPP